MGPVSTGMGAHALPAVFCYVTSHAGQHDILPSEEEQEKSVSQSAMMPCRLEVKTRMAYYPRRLYSRRRGLEHAAVSACLFFYALKGKWLELSARKSVDIARHGRASACTDPEATSQILTLQWG